MKLPLRKYVKSPKLLKKLSKNTRKQLLNEQYSKRCKLQTWKSWSVMSLKVMIGSWRWKFMSRFYLRFWKFLQKKALDLPIQHRHCMWKSKRENNSIIIVKEREFPLFFFLKKDIKKILFTLSYFISYFLNDAQISCRTCYRGNRNRSRNKLYW